MQLKFGERNFVIFKDEADFYLCLGFLMNKSKGVRFDWESYENKWGIEGRIWIDNSSNAPFALSSAFSVGTPTVDHRLNCNEYILYLHKNFGIVTGRNQNLTYIQSLIPNKYLINYQTGLKL